MISLYVFRLSFRTSATIFITFSCSPSPLATTWGSATKARPLATRSWSVVATPSNLSVTIEWWAAGTLSIQRHLRSHSVKTCSLGPNFGLLMNGIVWASPYHLSLSLSLSLISLSLISLSHLSSLSLSSLSLSSLSSLSLSSLFLISLSVSVCLSPYLHRGPIWQVYRMLMGLNTYQLTMDMRTLLHYGSVSVCVCGERGGKVGS